MEEFDWEIDNCVSPTFSYKFEISIWEKEEGGLSISIYALPIDTNTGLAQWITLVVLGVDDYFFFYIQTITFLRMLILGAINFSISKMPKNFIWAHGLLNLWLMYDFSFLYFTKMLFLSFFLPNDMWKRINKIF